MAKKIVFSGTYQLGDATPVEFRFRSFSHLAIANPFYDVLENDYGDDIPPPGDMKVVFKDPQPLAIEIADFGNKSIEAWSILVEATVRNRIEADLIAAVEGYAAWVTGGFEVPRLTLEVVDHALTAMGKNERRTSERLALIHDTLQRQNWAWARDGWADKPKSS